MWCQVSYVHLFLPPISSAVITELVFMSYCIISTMRQLAVLSYFNFCYTKILNSYFVLILQISKEITLFYWYFTILWSLSSMTSAHWKGKCPSLTFIDACKHNIIVSIFFYVVGNIVITNKVSWNNFEAMSPNCLCSDWRPGTSLLFVTGLWSVYFNKKWHNI